MAAGTLVITAPDGTVYAIPDTALAAFRVGADAPLVVSDPDGQLYSIPQADLARFALSADPGSEVQGYAGGTGCPMMGPTTNVTGSNSAAPPGYVPPYPGSRLNAGPGLIDSFSSWVGSWFSPPGGSYNWGYDGGAGTPAATSI